MKKIMKLCVYILFLELIMSGIGYHHAGMLLNDKNQVVELFRSGYLPILVATSTLGNTVIFYNVVFNTVYVTFILKF